MYHSAMFRVHTFVHQKNRMFSSRWVHVCLIMINLINSLVLAVYAAGADSGLAICAMMVNVLIVLCSFYGIYFHQAVFLMPNISIKLGLCIVAMFYSLQLVAENVHFGMFMWLFVTVLLYLAEAHAHISAAFGMLKEQSVQEAPPSYEKVVKADNRLPSYEEAARNIPTSCTTVNITTTVPTVHNPVPQPPTVLNIETLPTDVQVV